MKNWFKAIGMVILYIIGFNIFDWCWDKIFNTHHFMTAGSWLIYLIILLICEVKESYDKD